MFGSIFRMRPKAGQDQAVIKYFEDWGMERGYKQFGAIASYVFRPENSPEDLIGVYIFHDRETYVQNANDPAQSEWNEKLRPLLEADPEFEHCEIPVMSQFR